MYPLIQAQVKEFPLSLTLHLAPFRHGLDSHALNSFFEKKKRKKEKKKEN